jgi:hypothetical protein
MENINKIRSMHTCPLVFNKLNKYESVSCVFPVQWEGAFFVCVSMVCAASGGVAGTVVPNSRMRHYFPMLKVRAKKR